MELEKNPEKPVTLYRWHGVGQAAPPCGYVVGTTVYALDGTATHTIAPGEGGSGTVYARDGTPVMTMADNWFYAAGSGVMFTDMNEPRPWRLP
jgi:hypothetical protein